MEDIDLKIKIYIQEKQTTFIQAQEILVILAKNILGSSDNKTGSSGTIESKMKNLPVLNDVNDVRQWFERQKNDGS